MSPFIVLVAPVVTYVLASTAKLPAPPRFILLGEDAFAASTPKTVTVKAVVMAKVLSRVLRRSVLTVLLMRMPF